MATTAKFDPIAQFNSNKGFVTAPESNIDEGVFPFYIQGSDLELSRFKDEKTGADQYQLKIIVGLDDPDGTVSKTDLLTMLYQNVRFTTTHEMVNPCYPSYTTKAGKKYPASVLYEILEAAKEYDSAAYEKAKLAATEGDSVNWAKFIKGLKFNFNAKIGNRNDGTGKFVILMTEKAKIKEEEYQAKKDTGASAEVAEPVRGDKLIIPDDLPF